MNDPNLHADDPTSLRSVAVWWRALTCVPLGALMGFVCTLAILAGRGIYSPIPMTGEDAWQLAIAVAISRGALLGAIYLPFAYLIFLRKERLIGALVGISVGTILFGIVGIKFVGPAGPIALSASLGFWLSCIAIYANRERRRNEYGWQGYFAPPMRKK